jgi:hypothetical protein
MKLTADRFIAAGFWSQLVLLFLLDWGTLVAFSRQGARWFEVAGFVLVNALLLVATALTWRFMRGSRRRVGTRS